MQTQPRRDGDGKRRCGHVHKLSTNGPVHVKFSLEGFEGIPELAQAPELKDAIAPILGKLGIVCTIKGAEGPGAPVIPMRPKKLLGKQGSRGRK